MMKIGKHLCRATVIFVGLVGWISPSSVHAVPNLEDSKDYLHSPKAAIDWNQKRVAFKGLSLNWINDVQWFAKEAGLELVVVSEPNDLICGIRPAMPGPIPLRSMTEVFDVINEVLQGSTKFTMVRGQGKLYLIAADAPDECWPELPRVQIGDLSKRSRTEFVEVVANLGTFGVESDRVAGQIKKLLGEFGQVTPVGDDHYLIRGTVQHLRLAFDYLREG